MNRIGNFLCKLLRCFLTILLKIQFIIEWFEVLNSTLSC